MDYQEKYLKYKQKYLKLKSHMYGGGFEDVWTGLESRITVEHMIELNKSIQTYDPKFTPHPLTSTIDGIRAAFVIMGSADFKTKFKGVVSRNIQPLWYKDNPEMVTIFNNPNYFKTFKSVMELIKEQPPQQPPQQTGGGKTIHLIGRAFSITMSVMLLPIALALFIPLNFVSEGEWRFSGIENNICNIAGNKWTPSEIESNHDGFCTKITKEETLCNIEGNKWTDFTISKKWMDDGTYIRESNNDGYCTKIPKKKA